MNNIYSFDAGLISNSIWSIISVGMIVLFVYIAILLVRYLRRGIKYYDMQLNQKTTEKKEPEKK